MDSPYNGGHYYPEDLRAFLLGRVQEADANPIEQHLIEDETFFREVQDTEDELIDEYAMGVLPQTDEIAVAQYCERQPDLAQRLAMRKALLAALHSLPEPARSSPGQPSRITPSRPSQTRWFSISNLVPALAIAAGLLLVVCIFLLHQEHRVETHLAQLEQMQTKPQLQTHRAPVATAALSGVSEIFFPEHASRGASEQTPFQMSAGPSRLVEFQLETPVGMSKVQRWTVSITHQHDTLFLQRGLQTQQMGSISFARAYIDPSTLDPGSYSVVLSSEAGSQSSYSTSWLLVVAK